MSNLRLLLPRAFLLLRGIFLSVRLASRHAFPSHKLLVSRATLHRDARHPVAAVCSCRAVVIFGRVERRASVLGIRQMLLWFFASPLPPPLLFRHAIVFHECFARLRFSRAWLSGMHPVSRSAADRRLSRYFCLRWEVGQFHALCSLKSLFLHTLVL